MIEQEIENAVVQKIRAMELDGLEVVGMWEVEKQLKGQEGSNAVGYAVVKVPPCSFDTFGICECQFDCSIVLVVRSELCPTGDALLKYCDPIQKMLVEWNLKTPSDELTDFDFNDFTAGGIQVNGGTGPDADQSSKTYSIQWNMSIRGIVNHD